MDQTNVNMFPTHDKCSSEDQSNVYALKLSPFLVFFSNIFLQMRLSLLKV